MLYQRKRFTVGATRAGAGEQCVEKGHSGADSKGRCYCCGQVLGPQMQPTTYEPPQAQVGTTAPGMTVEVSDAVPESEVRFLDQKGGIRGRIINLTDSDDAADARTPLAMLLRDRG
jgi:hypothetical protein